MIWWIQSAFFVLEMAFAVLMLQVGMTLLNVPVPHGWREHLVYFFGVISIMSAAWSYPANVACHVAPMQRRMQHHATVRRFIEVTILKCALGKDEVNKFLNR